MKKKEFDNILKEEQERQKDDLYANGNMYAESMSDYEMAQALMKDPNNKVVWRIFGESSKDSIFQTGYSAEFFGDGEGSTHGHGVYTFYDTRGVMGRLGTNKDRLGNSVMKCVLLGGFSNFLVLNKSLAIKYYGSDDIRTQVDQLYDNQFIKDEILKVYKNVMHSFKIAPDNVHVGKVSIALKQHFDRLTEKKLCYNGLRSGKCRGVCYNGGNDHFASVTYNPKEIVPIAVTHDRQLSGHDFKNWEFGFTKEMWYTLQKVKDYESYGEHLKAKRLIKDYTKMPPQNDCMMVQLLDGNYTMYNITESRFVSTRGFKQCFAWETYNTRRGDSFQLLPVTVGKGTFYLKRNPKTKEYDFLYKKKDVSQVMTMDEYDAHGIGRDEDYGLISESDEGFSNLYGDGRFMNVFHRTESSNEEAIFSGGFSEEFTGINANIAGPGIYVTFSPRDSNSATYDFGPSMFECKLKNGLEGFLIPEGVVINGVSYRKPLSQQLYEYADPRFKNEIVKKYGRLCGTNDAGTVYKELLRNGDFGKTDIRGLIYRYCGVWAGVVADWSSVVPYRVSHDDGKTWEVGLTKSSVDFMKQYPNVNFILKRLIAYGIIKDTFHDKSNNNAMKNQQFVHGYIRVVLARNSKISFYNLNDGKLVSMRGFDSGIGATEREEDGEMLIVIPVQINGKEYFVYRQDDGVYALYEDSVITGFVRDGNGRIINTAMYDGRAEQ